MLLKGCQGLAGAWQPGARWPLLATAAPALKQSTTYPIGLTLLSIQEQNLLFLAALTAAGVMCAVNQQVAAELSAANDCSQGPLESLTGMAYTLTADPPPQHSRYSTYCTQKHHCL